MEDEKAAAYYDELTRKGEAAARFKQGLGFSSQSSGNTNPTRGSAIPSSSSFLSNFVRASSPRKETDLQKQSQLENVQNKLKKKQNSESLSRVSDKRSSSRERDRPSRRRSRSRDRDDSRRRHRSSSRDRASGRDRERKIERRRRSRSRSNSSDEERRRRRSSRENYSRRKRSRSSSPGDRRSERGRGDGHKSRSEGKNDKEKNGGIDYSRVIKGYSEMTPAARVKAKMKLQLAQTVEKDTAKGMGAGWERFEFNKDAPLEDEEIEVAEDDVNLVKNIGQSFRFSAVEARREEQIKAAHDDAMFGAPAAQPSSLIEKEPILEDIAEESEESGLGVVNLISEKVLAKQNGSWRDRARKLKDG